MKDPFGAILLVIRDDPAVSAIVGQKVSAAAEDPPSVRLQAGAPTSRVPFGPNSGHVGMQQWVGTAHCYGTADPAGEILARQLAGAVSDALHGIGSVRRSNTLILRVWTPTIGEMQRDPDTDWPYHVVRIEAYAAAQADT